MSLGLVNNIEVIKKSGYMKNLWGSFLDKTLWNWRENKQPDKIVKFEEISDKRDPEMEEDLHNIRKNVRAIFCQPSQNKKFSIHSPSFMPTLPLNPSGMKGEPVSRDGDKEKEKATEHSPFPSGIE